MEENKINEEQVVENKQKNNKPLIIVLVLIILLTFGFCFWFFVLRDTNKEEANTKTSTTTKETSTTESSTTTTSTTTTTTTAAPSVEVAIPAKISTSCKVDSYNVPIVENNKDSILCGAQKLVMELYRQLNLYEYYPIYSIDTLNKIDNQDKLFSMYLWGLDEDGVFYKKTSDEILSAYQNVFGKEYKMDFTHIYDDFYDPVEPSICESMLYDKVEVNNDEDDEDDEEYIDEGYCFYVYDKKTKKYFLNPDHGGHGGGELNKGWLAYAKPVSYQVIKNTHFIKYHMIFLDEGDEDGKTPLLDLKNGEIASIRDYKITDKIYNKYKNKLSEITFTWDLIDNKLVLRSIT